MVMGFFQSHSILQVKVDETVTINQGVVCQRSKTKGPKSQGSMQGSVDHKV